MSSSVIKFDNNSINVVNLDWNFSLNTAGVGKHEVSTKINKSVECCLTVEILYNSNQGNYEIDVLLKLQQLLELDLVSVVFTSGVGSAMFSIEFNLEKDLVNLNIYKSKKRFLDVICNSCNRYCFHSSALPINAVKIYYKILNNPCEIFPKMFNSLYCNKEFSDITIVVNGKEYKAHKFILSNRSEVFHRMLTSEMIENKTNIINGVLL